MERVNVYIAEILDECNSLDPIYKYKLVSKNPYKFKGIDCWNIKWEVKAVDTLYEDNNTDSYKLHEIFTDKVIYQRRFYKRRPSWLDHNRIRPENISYPCTVYYKTNNKTNNKYDKIRLSK